MFGLQRWLVMTANELKEQVNTIISSNASLQLYLVLKNDGTYLLRKADIEDKTAVPELFKMFKENLSQTIINNKYMDVRNLSDDNEIPNAIYKYDYKACPQELELFEEFNIKDAVGVDKFDFEKDDIKRIFGFIVYIGTMEKGLALFKKHYPIALIKRDSFLLGAIKSRNRFEKISNDDILRINGEWQLIRIDNDIYVRDLNVLERNLGFTAFIRKAAIKTLKSVDDLQILKNTNNLYTELDNLAFARKLAAVQKNSEVFKKHIPAEAIIRFSKETEELKGQFKYDEKGEKIILATRAEKNAFIRLINDDYLKSQLTEEYYAANSKDRLKKQ